MGKFFTILNSLLTFGTINMTFIPNFNFINQKDHIAELWPTKISSNDENDFIYSGYLLRYFIYKSSNINKNLTIKMMEKNIINNKNIIFNTLNDDKISNIKMDTKELFEMSIISSIVNVSIYGMKTWKDFFAEAYSKWMTTPNYMKNKSWEILNNFFIDIYSNFQKDNFGLKTNSLQKQIDKIDKFIINSNVIYNTNLEKKPFDSVDLQYNLSFFDFGLQQLIPQDKRLWTSNYTFNAIKTGLIMWQSKEIKDIETNTFNFNGNILRDIIINNGIYDLTKSLGNMINDSYTKTSNSSITKFENFIISSRKKYYSSFNELDKNLKEITKYKNDYYNDNGSTIFLKDSLIAMQKYYKWENRIIEFLENQILNLFNLTYAITDNNFKYFLTGFIFSPDSPLKGQSKRTAAYTNYSFQLTLGTKKFISTRRAYIVVSAKEFDNALWKKIISEYQTGWWSSPNIFCTLNHEMGHAIDAYYGMIKKARNVAKKYFSSLLNNLGIKGQYKGNIFGYNNNIIYNKKINLIKIILIIIFGIFCVSIFIFITKNNKYKNKF